MLQSMNAAHGGHLMAEAIPLDAVMLFATGLTISLGHCLGMCGPLVGSLAAAQRRQGLEVRGQALAQGLHHAGRLSAYALIGALMALVGAAGGAAGLGRGLQAGLALAAGGLMIATGLVGWLPMQRLVDRSGLSGLAARLSGRLRGVSSTGGRFLLGVANGFLPCGPVYAVALAAMAASPLGGAAAMLLFGLGTVPALLLFALGVGRLTPTGQRRFQRLGSVLVMAIGLQLVLRGAAALGWVAHFRPGGVVIW